jgi:acyl-ACP thioesterase
MPLCESFRATNDNAQKIKDNRGIPFSNYQIMPRIADIDVNGHINNTKYIEWAINLFPKDFYMKTLVKELTVNYLSEGFCNEICSIVSTHADKGTLISEITRDSDMRKLCVVQFCVEPKIEKPTIKAGFMR